MSDNKENEIGEIQRRIEYLRNTDQISISEKIAITVKVLEIIETYEAEMEAV